MNCEKFETIIDELAREHVMDAALRAEGSAHAEICVLCAARLADERALTQGLRVLTMSTENIEAPLRVETALRTAFRQRAATPVSSTRVLAFASLAFNAKTSPRRTAWTAIAAMLLLAIGLTAATRSFYTSRETGTMENNAKHSNTALPAMAAFRKKQHDVPLPSTTPVEANDVKQYTTAKELLKLAEPFTTAKVAGAGSNLPHIVRRSDHKMRRRASGADFADTMATASENELATDFLPLVGVNNFAAQDGGQLVRVELPRSVLLAFGLPMNIERADEPVKADVFVGQDGLARAIRFVR